MLLKFPATVVKLITGLLLVTAGLLTACTPTVQLAAPREPITINLNVHIDHEIRVKVDKELDDVLATNTELF